MLESLVTVMINGMEMMSPVIKHASWGTERENLLAVVSMLFLGMLTTRIKFN